MPQSRKLKIHFTQLQIAMKLIYYTQTHEGHARHINCDAGWRKPWSLNVLRCPVSCAGPPQYSALSACNCNLPTVFGYSGSDLPHTIYILALDLLARTPLGILLNTFKPMNNVHCTMTQKIEPLIYISGKLCAFYYQQH